jgi:nucleotide-binding universal stress UspA family protein
MNTVRSILYATDFSAQSEAAFPMAVALARDYGAQLIIAHVMPTPQVAYTMETMAVFEPEETAAEVRARLEHFDPKDPRISVEYMLAEGDAATEILNMARKTACDMIVIGTHGRTGISRIIAGSVAEQVLRHAPCPVLSVRCPVPKKDLTAEKEWEEIARLTPVLS